MVLFGFRINFAKFVRLGFGWWHNSISRNYVLVLPFSVFLQVRLLSPQSRSSSESAVETCSIEDHSILDIVSRVRHDCHLGILSGRKLLKVDHLKSLGLYQRPLRIIHQEEKRVSSMPLIVSNGTNGLLAHGALIGVSRRLVVMWVRNQTGYDTENAERLNFHVSCALLDALLIQGNQSVDLFVHIQVLDDAFAQEVVEVSEASVELIDVLLGHLWAALLNNDQRPNEPAAICGNEYCIHLLILVNGNELLDSPSLSQESEILHELVWLSVHTNRLTIEVNHVVLRRVHLIATDHVGIFHAKVYRHFMERLTR